MEPLTRIYVSLQRQGIPVNLGQVASIQSLIASGCIENDDDLHLALAAMVGQSAKDVKRALETDDRPVPKPPPPGIVSIAMGGAPPGPPKRRVAPVGKSGRALRALGVSLALAAVIAALIPIFWLLLTPGPESAAKVATPQPSTSQTPEAPPSRGVPATPVLATPRNYGLGYSIGLPAVIFFGLALAGVPIGPFIVVHEKKEMQLAPDDSAVPKRPKGSTLDARDLHVLGNELGLTRGPDARQLDAARTVTRTVQAAGYFTPVFRPDRRPPNLWFVPVVPLDTWTSDVVESVARELQKVGLAAQVADLKMGGAVDEADVALLLVDSSRIPIRPASSPRHEAGDGSGAGQSSRHDPARLGALR